MNTKAEEKLPLETRIPITTGITIEDKAPHPLNIPPANPIKCLGANAVTNTQVMVAKPFPKKAIDINKIIKAGLETKSGLTNRSIHRLDWIIGFCTPLKKKIKETES
ncbi:hypothetical protein OGM84_10770 [Pediococcus acidilactici]